jgi:pyruvate kinase
VTQAGSRKTKILATLGPASQESNIIEQMILGGADAFRLNFSHGSHDYFKPLIERIRSAAAKTTRPVSILQDLQGPKIRTGLLKNHQPVYLETGKTVVITTEEVEGTASEVSTNYSGMPDDVKPGDPILIDDGAIELKVATIEANSIIAEVITGGWLNEKKGINLPGTQISAPSLTEKDIADARFGVEMKVDYIALSFVRSGWDVLALKNLVTEWNYSDVKIIAKIEKPEAVRNIKEILEASDGIMVARGDLGVELPAEKVPLIQKRLIERANKSEKLAITATQMLESMVHNVRPTRAEASDVANAILDGTDVLMLSQETAIGEHPVRTIKTMALIARYTESDDELVANIELKRPHRLTTFTHGIVHSARAAVVEMKAKAIMVFTQSGMTANLASSQRPPCPIYAFTPLERTYRQLALVWGVHPIIFEFSSSTDDMIKRAEELLLASGAVHKGDVVVIVSGTNPVRGATNMMKIERFQ